MRWVREDSRRLLAKLAILAKGAAAAVFAKELFIRGQPFQTQNKRWKT